MDEIVELKKNKYLLVGLIFFSLCSLSYVLCYSQDLQKCWNSLFFIASLGGSLLLYADFLITNKESRFWARWITLVALIVLAVIYYFSDNVWVLIVFFWVVGLFYLIITALYSAKNIMKFIKFFCIYLSLPLFVFLSNFFLELGGHHHPFVKDEFLMAIDGTLGIYPSLIMARFYFLLPEYLSLAVRIIYFALPVAFIIIYKMRHLIEHEPPLDLMIEFIIIGIVGCALYNLVPACGTLYAFQATWPDALPLDLFKDGPHVRFCPTTYPRNCIPSLHTAWLVCLFRSGWQCNKVTKLFLSIWVVGTIIAMFGPGAHYLVDIVVGFAFANCIGGLSAFKLSIRNPVRRQAIGLGFLLCFVWYVIIFYGLSFLQSSILLAWIFFWGSILLSMRIEFCLIKYLNYKEKPFCERYKQSKSMIIN